MKPVLTLALIAAAACAGAFGKLYISGPESPVQEGDDVLLECSSDGDWDMENYTFQKYSSWMKSWIQLDAGKYFRCWYFRVNISRSDGRLMLQLRDVSEWQGGPYRCLGIGNDSSEVNVSENFTVPVVYLQDIYFQKMHSWYTSVSDILWAKEGSTVEVKCSASSNSDPIYEWSQQESDWILPSDTLTIKHVDESSEGTYVCQARHPDMRSLVKTRSFQLQVIPIEPETSEVQAFSLGLNREDLLLYIALPGVLFVALLITFLVVILRLRQRQLKKPVISLIDGEKRTPIYKGSLQSVSSGTSDTQPLVM